MTTKTSQYLGDVKDEQKFWEHQDPQKFLEPINISDQFGNLKPSTKIITLRVPEHLLTNLKLIANKRDIPYQSLLKMFLQDKVNEELQTPFLQLKRKMVKKAATTLVALVVTGIFTYSYVAQPIRAQGISMDPSYPTNTYYVLDKFAYTTSAPQRGDVVVFHSPTQPGSLFFKRIVGLPGEKVSIQGGGVSINGVKLEEPYEQGTTAVKTFPHVGEEITVPGNSYYVLGDNRVESTDSRDFGFVTKENITGKVAGCCWNCK